MSVMFERFSEKARRVIFFARYEASQLGGRGIEPEHLLLGLLREDEVLLKHLLPGDGRKKLQERLRSEYRRSPSLATYVEIPLSDEAKRALHLAAQEADRLEERRIDTPHLLLGLLLGGSRPAQFLEAAGVDRQRVESYWTSRPPEPTPSEPEFSSGEGRARNLFEVRFPARHLELEAGLKSLSRTVRVALLLSLVAGLMALASLALVLFR